MSRGPRKSFDPEVALEKAMQLFRARGYAATGLSDLLEAMGIARKSLYDTFGGKRDLFVRALELYARKELGALEQTLCTAGSPLENIRRVLDRWQAVHGEKDSPGCLLGNNTAHFDVGDQEMRALLDRHYRDLERAFRTALTRAQMAGELGDAADADDLACLLVAATQGLALVSRTRDDGALARGAVRAVLSALESPTPATGPGS